MSKFKKGDVVVCVDNTNSKDANRYLVVGEIYEITRDPGLLKQHGVWVDRKIRCCRAHKQWLSSSSKVSNLFWKVNRFQKVGSVV